jgi:hypothetical protein
MLQAAFALSDTVCAACAQFRKTRREVWAAVWACEKVLQQGELPEVFLRKGGSRSE